MSLVLDFHDVTARPERAPSRAVARGAEIDPFWPSCRQGSPDEPAADPANAPRRVLSEMAVVLAGVGALVLAATSVFPGP